MAACSRPDCTALAVLQWQRAATPDETTAYYQSRNQQRAVFVEAARQRVRLHIAELQLRAGQIPPHDPRFAELTEHTAAAIAAQEERLAGIVDPAPLTVATDGPVTVAVFACPDHALDAETAAVFHDADCPAPSGKCDCDVSA